MRLWQSSDFVDLPDSIYVLSSTSGAIQLWLHQSQSCFLSSAQWKTIRGKIDLHTNILVIINTSRISWRTKLVPTISPFLLMTIPYILMDNFPYFSSNKHTLIFLFPKSYEITFLVIIFSGLLFLEIIFQCICLAKN